MPIGLSIKCVQQGPTHKRIKNTVKYVGYCGLQRLNSVISFTIEIQNKICKTKMSSANTVIILPNGLSESVKMELWVILR